MKKDSEKVSEDPSKEANPVVPVPKVKRILGKTYLHPTYNIPAIWDNKKGDTQIETKKPRWICVPHKKNLFFCKHCNVADYFCIHGSQKWRCTICEGATRICKHNIRQERCAICDGSELCDHNLRVHSCIICNPEEVLINRVRSRVWNAIKNHKKEYRTLDLLGCTVAKLKLHLESQFAALPGVTWETYGINGWEIDHRKPCNAFDLSDPAQQLACFHYTNLQPMWSGDNQSKSDTFDEATFTHTWTGNEWVLKT